VVAGVMAGLLVGAVSVDVVGERFQQRAVLAQKYDTASGGRFDAQLSALGNIAEDPVGVGPGRSAVEFGLEPHNLYLHVYSESGWLGGTAFLLFVAASVFRLWGTLRHDWPLRDQTSVVFACLVGVLLQSLFIDSTHWRHMWLLLAMAWALDIACRRSQFQSTGLPFMSSAAYSSVSRRYASGLGAGAPAGHGVSRRLMSGR